jgi:uncharacterized protein (TIGR02996 family)
MATDEQRALWAAIRAHPDDDTPRLVYADWLQENGDEPRAEFIRLQIEQNALFSPSALCSDSAERRLTKREAKLIRLHRDEWFRGLSETFDSAVKGFNWAHAQKDIKFARGFVREILLPLEVAPLLAARDSEIEPIEGVKILNYNFDPEKTIGLIRGIAAWPNGGCICEIDTYGASDESVNVVVNGRFDRLRRLRFYMGTVTDAGAVLLANWPQAVSLRVLDLGLNELTDVGLAALTNSAYLDKSLQLHLAGNHFTTTGWNHLRARFRNCFQ